MTKLSGIKPEKVFEYFEKICEIPHGSENMSKISAFCIEFAKKHSLKYYTDANNNVVIYKNGSAGYEDSEPIILQGHLDMVCQKTEDADLDFSTDGLDLFVDGDMIGAKDTTLGADNGIAVAMVLSILSSNDIEHPPIEAVFTTDEEIGMIGALGLDMSVLRSKRMINLDSEEDNTVTVSCAGGSELSAKLPLITKKSSGMKAKLIIKGLRGGHSGVEINSGRVNASILAGRILSELDCQSFEIISVFGGDKSNAITNSFSAELCVNDFNSFKSDFTTISGIIKREISTREPDFAAEVCLLSEHTGEFYVFDDSLKDDIIFTLCCCPNGVMEMSREINGLVETSLNLGIVKTTADLVSFNYALRSNKMSTLDALERKLLRFFSKTSAKTEIFGKYPAWEYNSNSYLQNVYKTVYKNNIGEEPNVEAIHAGLECGVFSSQIEGIDCIAIGPQLYDVHTVNERLSISSTVKFYNILIDILKTLK